MELDKNEGEIALCPNVDKNEAEIALVCQNVDKIEAEIALTINEDDEGLGDGEKEQQTEIDFKPELEVEKKKIPIMSILTIIIILGCEVLDATALWALKMQKHAKLRYSRDEQS